MINFLDNYSATEIEERVKKLEAAGWEWHDYRPDRKRVLSPPENDPRKFWAAMWCEISDDRILPHWAMNEDALEKRNAS